METPLPLGPLPPPPGPLDAKHSKRAQGAVFNGTHSPARSEPSSPPPGSPQRAGGHPSIAPGAELHVRSRRVTTSFVPLELSSELCASPNLLGWSGWVRKSSTAARYTLSANFRSEQMKANRFDRRLQPIGSQEATSVHQTQHWFTESNISSPNATQGCKTRQVGRVPISGPPSGPSGSPQSPAEPHPPSLAWVETPLPLGPLPLPPGPLDAKHSKRALGAVFNGTHRPVRS